MKWSLGIDTSNYTSSIALTDEEGKIVGDLRKLLPVPEGQTGLRQQEAFFHHVQNLPILLEKMFRDLPPRASTHIKTIAVSTRPRPIEGSYMPVFTAGASLARSLSTLLSVPLYMYSHQEGHLRAAMVGKTAKICAVPAFGFFHFSGGTTEALLVEKKRIRKIGGSLDISLGQLLDRLGGLAGFPFPSGSYLDAIAYRYLLEQKEQGRDLATLHRISRKVLPSVKVHDVACNLSGLETAVKKQWKTMPEDQRPLLIASLFLLLSDLIRALAAALAAKTGVHIFLLAGGVSASRTLRRIFEEEETPDLLFSFSDPHLSSDNAVGVALLGGEEAVCKL